MKKFVFLLLFLISFLILSSPFSAKAHRVFHHEFFERYDPNTEIFIRGRIREVRILPEHKFVVISVERKGKIYKAIVAPYWFVEKKKIKLKPEEEIIIKGSKFISEKGELFIFTRYLYVPSKNCIYHLRDKKFKPYWKKKK
jgi:hypothetical protein